MGAPIKKLRDWASIALLSLAILNFTYRCIFEYGSIGIGDVVLVGIFLVLFFFSQSWLLRLSTWTLVVFAILLPFGWFPIFGDEPGNFFAEVSIMQKIVMICATEFVLLFVVGFLVVIGRIERGA